MTAHPSALWKEPEPPKFELVRPRGMETMHQRRIGEEAALCGLKPGAPLGIKRWAVYKALPPDAPFCAECWVVWGRDQVADARASGGVISKTTIQKDAAWPFSARGES